MPYADLCAPRGFGEGRRETNGFVLAFVSVAGQRGCLGSVIIRIMVRMTVGRTTLIVAFAAVLVIAAAVWGARAADPDREWAHGGDDVTASALVRLADKPAFGHAVAALGGPADQVAVEDSELVVRVRWSGPDNRAGGGHYEFVVLDGTGGPTLLPLNAWGTGVDGFDWRDAYEPLSTHYAWLAGTAFEPDGKGGELRGHERWRRHGFRCGRVSWRLDTTVSWRCLHVTARCHGP